MNEFDSTVSLTRGLLRWATSGHGRRPCIPAWRTDKEVQDLSLPNLIHCVVTTTWPSLSQQNTVHGNIVDMSERLPFALPNSRSVPRERQRAALSCGVTKAAHMFHLLSFLAIERKKVSLTQTKIEDRVRTGTDGHSSPATGGLPAESVHAKWPFISLENGKPRLNLEPPC